MTLEGLTIQERRRLTRMSPIMVSAKPNAGKSACVEGLDAEDRQRTVIVDIEAKGLPTTFDDDYFRVVRVKPSGIIAPEVVHLYEDYENVKYKTVTELALYIRQVLASDKVDRVVLDSFSALVEQLEVLHVTTSNGYSVWNAYNKELSAWLSLFKEEARFHGKYLYILGHYRPSKGARGKDGKVTTDVEAEKYTLVKGTLHFRMVEQHFNCVLTVEDHRLMADNDDEYTSTRIHKDLSPFETDLNSFKELEEKFAEIFTQRDAKVQK